MTKHSLYLRKQVFRKKDKNKQYKRSQKNFVGIEVKVEAVLREEID